MADKSENYWLLCIVLLLVSIFVYIVYNCAIRVWDKYLANFSLFG